MRQQVLLRLRRLVVLAGKLLLATCPMPMGRAMVAEQRQGEAGETGAGLAGPGLAQIGTERSVPSVGTDRPGTGW